MEFKKGGSEQFELRRIFSRRLVHGKDLKINVVGTYRVDISPISGKQSKVHVSALTVHESVFLLTNI